MTTGCEHKRLSELPTAADLDGGELLYLAQAGRPRQVSLAALARAIIPEAVGDHDHDGIYEPADETILKAADIGTGPGTVAAGDHHHGGDAASLGSGAASPGQVLTAGGSGGASWSAPARITVSATAPENPGLHDCWLDIA